MSPRYYSCAWIYFILGRPTRSNIQRDGSQRNGAFSATRKEDRVVVVPAGAATRADAEIAAVSVEVEAVGAGFGRDRSAPV